MNRDGRGRLIAMCLPTHNPVVSTLLLTTYVCGTLQVVVVRLVGQNFELNCISNTLSGVRWDFKAADNGLPVTMHNGKIVNKNFNKTFTVDFDSTTLVSRLNMSDIGFDDTGEYRCLTQGSTVIHLAQLTVLADVPRCSLNGSSTGRNESEFLQIRCQVDYSGQHEPDVECRELSGNTTYQLHSERLQTGSSRVHSYAFVSDVDSVSDCTQLTCITSFNNSASIASYIQLQHCETDDTDFGHVSDPHPAAHPTVSASPEISPTNGLTQLVSVVLVVVAAFITFLSAAVFCSVFHSKIIGGFCLKHKERLILPDTITSQQQQQQLQRDASCELSADLDVYTNHQVKVQKGHESEHVTSDTARLHSDSTGDDTSAVPVYAELMVSIIRSQRQSQSVQSTGVYADINHTLKVPRKHHRN